MFSFLWFILFWLHKLCDNKVTPYFLYLCSFYTFFNYFYPVNKIATYLLALTSHEANLAMKRFCPKSPSAQPISPVLYFSPFKIICAKASKITT